MSKSLSNYKLLTGNTKSHVTKGVSLDKTLGVFGFLCPPIPHEDSDPKDLPRAEPPLL